MFHGKFSPAIVGGSEGNGVSTGVADSFTKTPRSRGLRLELVRSYLITNALREVVPKVALFLCVGVCACAWVRAALIRKPRKIRIQSHSGSLSQMFPPQFKIPVALTARDLCRSTGRIFRCEIVHRETFLRRANMLRTAPSFKTRADGSQR